MKPTPKLKLKPKLKPDDYEFSQKKINHIFHYLDNFEFLLKILKDGFAPSYCEEGFENNEYYIPMVSFCNIPLRDVDLFMRYGKYGIGMSLDWAIQNYVSPVIYLHETTPFKEQIYFEQRNPFIVPFFKNWKTKYKGKDIITYQEREWRYIPRLNDDKPIITRNDSEFELLKAKKFRKKPHLPNHILNFNNIDDLRYVVILNEIQRNKVLKVLNKKFGEDAVINSIVGGRLIILNDDLIRNDF